MPMVTSPAGIPMTLPVMCGPSSSSTIAKTYRRSGANAGEAARRTMVKLKTVARPEVDFQSNCVERHLTQKGRG